MVFQISSEAIYDLRDVLDSVAVKNTMINGNMWEKSLFTYAP